MWLIPGIWLWALRCRKYLTFFSTDPLVNCKLTVFSAFWFLVDLTDNLKTHLGLLWQYYQWRWEELHCIEVHPLSFSCLWLRQTYLSKLKLIVIDMIILWGVMPSNRNSKKETKSQERERNNYVLPWKKNLMKIFLLYLEIKASTSTVNGSYHTNTALPVVYCWLPKVYKILSNAIMRHKPYFAISQVPHLAFAPWL